MCHAFAAPPWVPAATPPNNRVPGLRIDRGGRRVKDAPEVVTTMAVVPLVDRGGCIDDGRRRMQVEKTGLLDLQLRAHNVERID